MVRAQTNALPVSQSQHELHMEAVGGYNGAGGEFGWRWGGKLEGGGEAGVC